MLGRENAVEFCRTSAVEDPLGPATQDKTGRGHMHLTSSQLAELTLLLFAKRAESDLEEETDERAALRKAVLVLAALNQDNQSEAAKQFSRYILTSFEPLLSHLDHFNHRIWDGHTIGIRANSDGEPLVAIKRETVLLPRIPLTCTRTLYP